MDEATFKMLQQRLQAQSEYDRKRRTEEEHAAEIRALRLRAERAETERESLRAQLAARDADLEIARGATDHWIARCRRLESKGDPR